MARGEFTPDYFKIRKLSQKINISRAINASLAESANNTSEQRNIKILYTFNQLMKYNGEIAYVFVFDENSIEIPCLMSFCKYFKISLFVLNSQDISEIKNEIKFATMVCIPKDLNLETEFIKGIENEMVEIEHSFCKIALNN
jgi:hypothetical protein